MNIMKLRCQVFKHTTKNCANFQNDVGLLNCICPLNKSFFEQTLIRTIIIDVIKNIKIKLLIELIC